MTWEQERIGACTLYRGDALEILPTLPPVDYVLTDPPWQVSTGHLEINIPHVGPVRHPTRTLAPDILGPWHQDMIVLTTTCCQGDAFFFAGYKELGALIVAMPHYRGTFAWHHGNAHPARFYPAKMDLAFIVWGAKKSALYGWQHWPSMVFSVPVPQAGCMAKERIVDASGRAMHPAQGPLVLYEKLLQPLPYGTCLDPFMGTGTTGLACVRQGRSFVGIEIEPRYFDLACQRIEEAQRQGELFVAPTPSRVVQEVLL